MLIVKKVLNNNFILTVDGNGKEHVVLGKGLRFHNEVGKPLDEDGVEKVFVLQGEKEIQNYARLLEETPVAYEEAVRHVIDKTNQTLGGKLHDQIFVLLLDHIVYAIERVQKGIRLQNRLLGEIQKFYPVEFSIGLEAVDYLNSTLGVALPEEEAGNIAFHLVNAQSSEMNMETTMYSVKLLKDFFSIIQLRFPNSIDHESLNYTRFVTHMQFFIRRLLDDRMLEAKDTFLYDQITKEYPKAAACAASIGDYVERNLGKRISTEELLYLTVHLERIVRN